MIRRSSTKNSGTKHAKTAAQNTRGVHDGAPVVQHDEHQREDEDGDRGEPGLEPAAPEHTCDVGACVLRPQVVLNIHVRRAPFRLT